MGYYCGVGMKAICYRYDIFEISMRLLPQFPALTINYTDRTCIRLYLRGDVYLFAASTLICSLSPQSHSLCGQT